MRHPRRATGRSVALAVALPLMAAALLAACGKEPTAQPATTTSAPAETSATATAALCDEWGSEEVSDDELTALIADAVPAELADDLALMTALQDRDRAATEAGDPPIRPTEEEAASLETILAWVQDACAGDVVKVAPPLDALPEELAVCAAFATPASTSGDAVPADQAVVYAPAASDDPYAGPVVALLWGSEYHAGDGDSTPVTVRGTEGEVAPITVFQQVVLEELGSVVAWTEGDVSFGLYGRGWDSSRAGELVAMADAMVGESGGGAKDGSFTIPQEALPAGFEQVFSGASTAASPMGTGDYTVSLTPASIAGTDEAEAAITISGAASDPGTEELWRLFALQSERTQINGVDVAFTATAWSDRGPVIASWRPDADHHVTIMSIGTNGEDWSDTVRALVGASRELTADEWTELVTAPGSC